MLRIDRGSYTGVAAALGAAALFGAGTPLAKLLLDSVSPWLLAGLLYLGSGLGLTLYRKLTGAPAVRLAPREAAWFAAHSFQFPGVELRARWVREYPQGASAGHVVGYIGRIAEGDNEEPKPGFADVVARANWDAWKKLEGTTADEAMQQYVELIDDLRQ